MGDYFCQGKAILAAKTGTLDIKAMHCQFTLLVYILPDSSFAGLHTYVAVYVINVHICAGTGYKILFLHGDHFGCLYFVDLRTRRNILQKVEWVL